MDDEKYPHYTDEIYKVIFKESAAEYKKNLQLEEKTAARDTTYAEVLHLIASFEIGIADALKFHSEKLERKLVPEELDALILEFSTKRHWIPQLEDAHCKMTSRNYGFRQVVHDNLKSYITAVSA